MRLLAMALAVCLLASCGGSNSRSGAAKRMYERDMAAVVPRLQSDILKLRFALEQVRSPVVARHQLDNLETKLREGAARLQALTAPGGVASEHASLISGYRSLRAEFDRSLRPTLGRRSTDAFRVGAGRLAQARGFQVVAHALQAIIAKGYDIGFPKGS